VARSFEPADMRSHPLLVGVLLAAFVGWVVVANVVADRVALPLLVPEAAAGPLRVTNNDGTLSNGDKLSGWRNGVYFAVLAAVVTAGYASTWFALRWAWPGRAAPPPTDGDSPGTEAP
jgi:hypothetical protein